MNLSILVLDYRKPVETRQCLESLRRHMKVPCKIVYLDNGSNEQYPWSFYQEGLCDIIISKKVGMGGGFGQTDLFRWCDTKYAIFVQSDQVLMYDINQDAIDTMIKCLNDGARCIDLNGDQSQKGRWTDRAHFIDVEWFNSLAPFPNGGPGLDHLRWNENYLQEVFDNLGNPIVHIRPVLFRDNGRVTIRELPCGGVVQMETDTKKVSWIKTPKQPYMFPEMSDEEWNLSISGNWVSGTVPKKYLERGESFDFWSKIL